MRGTLASKVWRFVRGSALAVICAIGAYLLAQAVDQRVPIETWLVWDLLPLWGYSALFVGACLFAGNAVLRALMQEKALPPVEWLLQSLVVGLVVFVLGLYAAGFAHLLTPSFALAWPLVLLALGARPASRTGKRMAAFLQSLPPLGPGQRVLFSAVAGWGALCIGFVYLSALHPSAINFDSAWYHLPIAQDYAREGWIMPFPGENHRAFPHLASVVYAWALLVPSLDPLPLDWMLALHLDFVMVLFRIVGVVAAAQYLLGRDRTPALWVTFFLFPSIFIYDQNVGAAADQFIAASAVPVFLGLARSLPSLDPRHLVVLGLTMGCHVLTKYQGVYLALAVIVVLGVRWSFLLVARAICAWKRTQFDSCRATWRRLWLGPVVLLLVTGATTAPHFVKNSVYYGNPAYPFATSVFPTTHPVHPAELYELRPPKKGGEFDAKGHGLERQLWAAKLLFKYPFETRNRNLTKHRPYMGFLFSLLLPCVVFVRRSGRFWLGGLVFFLCLLVWANTSANDRYLLSFLGIGIGMTAALLVRIWEMGWVSRVALVPLVALQLFWGGEAMLTYGGKQVRATMKLIDSGYSGKTADERFSMHSNERKITAATPPEAVILSRNYKGLLGLDRMVLSDIHEMQGYVTYSGVRSPQQMWEQLRAKGVTHLLYPKGRRRPHRWNNTVLFGALAHHAVDEQRIGGLVLSPLPATPPPGPEPYLVLTSGIREFPDGLYRVEQLDLDDREAGRATRRPEPIEPLKRRHPEPLINRAHAIAIGRGALPSEAHVRQHFDLVEEFHGGYALYLRKLR